MTKEQKKEVEEAVEDSEEVENMRYNLERAITSEFEKIEFKLKEAEEAKVEAKLDGKRDGILEGEAKGKAEAICQYLEVRFGAESQVLQERIHMITDLGALSHITNKIFFTTHLDEVTTLIEDCLVSQ